MLTSGTEVSASMRKRDGSTHRLCRCWASLLGQSMLGEGRVRGLRLAAARRGKEWRRRRRAVAAGQKKGEEGIEPVAIFHLWNCFSFSQKIN